jgi:hypothetical protein
MKTFATLLRDALAGRNLRISEWSRQEQLSQGYVSNLCAGRRAPPLAKVAGWAERFQLEDDERARFWEAAVLANIPRDVLPHVLRLLAADGRTRDQLLDAADQRTLESSANETPLTTPR